MFLSPFYLSFLLLLYTCTWCMHHFFSSTWRIRAGSLRVRTGWLTAAVLRSSCASVPATPSPCCHLPQDQSTFHGPEAFMWRWCFSASSFSPFRTVQYAGPFSLVYYFSLNNHVRFSQLLTSAVVFFPSLDLSSFSSNSCPFILRLSSFHALSL